MYQSEVGEGDAASAPGKTAQLPGQEEGMEGSASHSFFFHETETTAMNEQEGRQGREAEINCTVEKSGRVHLNQGIKVHITCNKTI